MRSEKEIEEWLKNWKSLDSRGRAEVTKFTSKKFGVKILQDFDHAGVDEWRRCLKWVLHTR